MVLYDVLICAHLASSYYSTRIVVIILFLYSRLVDDFERDIRFDVTVIEGLTERKQNTSSLLTLYKYKYKMELIKTSDSFKPGLKYTAFVS